MSDKNGVVYSGIEKVYSLGMEVREKNSRYEKRHRMAQWVCYKLVGKQ